MSMTEILAIKILKAKYIETIMNEKEIIEEIRNLFQVSIKNALISGRADTYQAASELLQLLRYDNNKTQGKQPNNARGGEIQASADGSARGQGHSASRGRPYQRGGPANYVPRGAGVNMLRARGGYFQGYRGTGSYRGGNYRGNYRPQNNNDYYYDEEPSTFQQGGNETHPKTLYEGTNTPVPKESESSEVNNPSTSYRMSEATAPPQAEN
jgi:hypothetical protein